MDRDLCMNCDHWREEHYGVTGEWQGQLFGCAEYQGGVPREERRAEKSEQVAASRQRVAQLRAAKTASWYDANTAAAEEVG